MSQGETVAQDCGRQTVSSKNYYGLIMELNTSHALQLAIMASTVIAGYAVVKSNLSRIMEDFEAFIKRYESQRVAWDDRLDDAEGQRMVFASQIEVLKEINSVPNLESKNRELATIQAELRVLQAQVNHLNEIHNSKHPLIEKN